METAGDDELQTGTKLHCVSDLYGVSCYMLELS